MNHGGIEAHRVDRARVEQLLRGAVYSDMMLVQLKLRDRKETPPSFVGHAICRVELEEPLSKGILMVEASQTIPLPASVLLQPMVLPNSALEVDHFVVAVQNQSSRDIVLPEGIVMGQLCTVDTVTATVVQKRGKIRES